MTLFFWFVGGKKKERKELLFGNQFRRPNEEKSDIFKPSRFEPLYQPFFGF